MIGRIKTFRPHHYGFITSNEKDYLFRSKQWEYRSFPKVGEVVTFEAELTDNGWRAIDIRRGEDGK